MDNVLTREFRATATKAQYSRDFSRLGNRYELMRRENSASPRDHSEALACHRIAGSLSPKDCRQRSANNRKGFRVGICNQTDPFSPGSFVAGNLFTESS
jgi:hypothetical protein